MSVAEENNLNPINWKAAYKANCFKIRLFIGIVLFAGILTVFPFFFQYIESRDGLSLDDSIVAAIPPHDVSIPIFIFIWSTTLLLALRCIRDPQLLLISLYCFIVLTLTRMCTIYFIPLNPPQGLIPLVDPLSNFFYGKTNFVTKDLFFSGHTSSQFIFFLSLKKKRDKAFALLSTLVVGCLVLVQHVHYTVDVVAAIPLTYLCFLLGRRIALGRGEASLTDH
ncbi:phosphatase PAP2-related protein [Taibaiella chishuiensis]|uniref:PAP2 superfamily protein n=1 Tax=Taibaiella chishuiensis TaxID=1434707 RepID=A0A2P8CWK9_9BACT|nr:phosphatase PAP2-related protein [Taibaiella chishuiensis]PSK89330.1 PAP2 superfamily protein [Taibaiella chishuiensis]